MTQMVVEIHIPLVPTAGVPEDEYQYPWIDSVAELLCERPEELAPVQAFDDGEEEGEVYIFFITGADEPELLAAATRIAGLPGVPANCFAVISNDEAEEFGQGRRVDLSVA